MKEKRNSIVDYSESLNDLLEGFIDKCDVSAVAFHGHSGYMRYVSCAGMTRQDASFIYSRYFSQDLSVVKGSSGDLNPLDLADHFLESIGASSYQIVPVTNLREKEVGIFIVFYNLPDQLISTDDMMSFAAHIAEHIEHRQLSLGLTNNQDLEEREKAQKCLHEISKLANKEVDIVRFLKLSVNELVHGFMYPSFTYCEVTYGSMNVQSNGLHRTQTSLKDERKSNRNQLIKVEVYYRADDSDAQHTFTLNEQFLLTSFADTLQLYINQKELQLKLLESSELQHNVNKLTKLGTWKLEIIGEVPQQPFLDSVSKSILGYLPDEQVAHEDILKLYGIDSGHFERDLDAMLLGEINVMELNVTTKEGENKWIRTSGQAHRLSENHIYLWGGILDITERRIAQKNVTRKAELLAAVAEIGNIINRNISPEISIKEGLAVGGRTVNADQMCFLFPEPNTAIFECNIFWVNPDRVNPDRVNSDFKTDRPSSQEKLTIRFNPDGKIYHQLIRGEIIQGLNVDQVEGEFVIKSDHEISDQGSLKLVPVIVDKELRGLLAIIHFNIIRVWDEEETKLLNNISFSLSDLLQRHSYQEKLKKSIEEIGNSERKHRLIFENINEGIAVLKDKRFIECNPYLAQLLETEQSNVIGKSPAHFSSKVQLDGEPSSSKYESLLQQIDENGEVEFEWLIQSSKETQFLCHIKLTKTKYDGESVLFAVVRDRSEINHAQQTILRLSEAVEQSHVGVVITSTEGIIEYVNEAVVKISRYKKEELLGQTPHIFSSGLTPKSVIAELWQKINNGEQWKGEFLNKRKNGEIYWEADVISPVLDENGQILNYIAIKEDVSKKKATESGLRYAQNRFQQIASINQSVIWETDLNGHFTYLSPGARSVYGYAPEELIGQFGDAFEKNSKLINKLKEQEVVMYEIYPRKHKSGKTVWLKTNALVITDDQGKITGFRGTDFDVTKELNAQKSTLNAAIRAEQKVRSEIAETLHDDLQQTLLAAQLHIGAVSKVMDSLDLKAVKRYGTGLKLLRESVEKTRKVSHELNPATIESVGLKQAIITMLKKFQEFISFETEYNLEDEDCPEEIGLIVYRILQEIINNIVKHSKATKVKLQISTVNANLLRLFVQDDGVGFDTFNFTSNSKGVGLSSMKANIRSLGGSLDVSSIPGKGTTIEANIPIIE